LRRGLEYDDGGVIVQIAQARQTLKKSRMRSAIISILVTMAGAAAASHSVWDGVFSKEQAGRGQTAYNSKCARCHGDALLGGEDAPPLVDQDFLKKWNGQSVGRLVELIRTTMPSDGPGKLSRQQSTDMAAYLLSANGFPEGKSDMPADAEALNEILLSAKK
jgi:S-disulfanyl-L-cysteine oxidoreductase SoxD